MKILLRISVSQITAFAPENVRNFKICKKSPRPVFAGRGPSQGRDLSLLYSAGTMRVRPSKLYSEVTMISGESVVIARYSAPEYCAMPPML